MTYSKLCSIQLIEVYAFYFLHTFLKKVVEKDITPNSMWMCLYCGYVWWPIQTWCLSYTNKDMSCLKDSPEQTVLGTGWIRWDHCIRLLGLASQDYLSPQHHWYKMIINCEISIYILRVLYILQNISTYSISFHGS